MKIIKIIPYDISNGERIRLSIWLAGCIHKCKGCWSPETWNPNQGNSLTDTKEELIEHLSNPMMTGVSLLGGDPLYHYIEEDDKELLELLKLCKKYNKDIWLWTGYEEEEIPNDVRKLIDVSITGKFDITKRDLNLPYGGSGNQVYTSYKEGIIVEKSTLKNLHID